MIKPSLHLALLLTAIMLSACSSVSPGATVGAVAGGVAGGLAGSAVGAGTGQLLAVGVGTAVGAGVGYSIGASMDHQYPGQVAAQGPAVGPTVMGQHAPPYMGPSGVDIGYASPVVYDYPPRTYPSNFQPSPAPINGCQKLYTVSPYSPTGYACLGPNGNWYINQ